MVNRAKETTPVRLVFDAAAKYGGKSLNDAISVGPNLLKPFLKCLFRFRLRKFAYIGDVSQMFCQIRLDESDRAFVRVVFPDPETGKITDLEINVGLFGVNSMPNISQKALLENNKINGEGLDMGKETVDESTYMDDLLDSKDEESEVSQVIKELIILLGFISMVPRKWMTNSKAVLKEIPEADRAKKALLGPEDELGPGKVLGVLWNPETDVLTFESKLSQACSTEIWTKRKVLSTLFRLFDPDGKASPFTIIGKIILQKIAVSQVKWDDPLEGPIVEEWKRWLTDSDKIAQIQIPRWLGFQKGATMTLHCFSDASIDAIACVFYLVTEYNGEKKSKFLFSKSKVTPIQAVTIAKLELCALLLAVTWCMKFKGYNIFDCPTYFWVDSLDVLYWLTSLAKHQKIFVSNRVGEIQRQTTPDQWKFVPGVQNPADIPSRGMFVEDLLKTNFYTGPDFICQPESSWPEANLQTKKPSDAALAEERKLTVFVGVNEGLVTYLQEDASVGRLWNGWVQLLKRTKGLLRVAIAWLMFRSNKIGNAKGLFQKCTLNDSELSQHAKLLLFKKAQQDDFGPEFEMIQAGKLPQGHNLKKYCPFVDAQGLIRANSRLDRSELLPEEVRYPVILPTSHKITRLFVEHLHHEIKHPVGTNAMIAEINKYVIIPGLYKVERKVRKLCMDCAKKNAKQVVPIMAPIPSYRYSNKLRAFSQIGIDFTGSFAIKQLKKLRTSRERPLMYVLVATCLQTRAVHFEATEGMTTQDVYQALCRLASRRGVPDLIVSDNYSTFKAVDKGLQELYQKIDFDSLEQMTGYEFMNSNGIKWHFSPPSGSHFGGVFEIVVKAFKRSFYAIYKRAELTRSEFITAVTECEFYLNSRPIVAAKNDGDTPVLTPNHFLIGQAGGQSLCPPLKERLNLYDRFHYLQETLDHFWSRFMCEFLPNLHARKKWTDEVKELRENQLVIHLDDQLPRGKWELVLVQKIVRGEDKRIRQVYIRTKDKKTLKRPVCKLLPIPVEERC